MYMHLIKLVLVLHIKPLQVLISINCIHFIFSAHSVTADVSIADTAQAAEYFLSDGVIVTGSSTNVPADTDELKGICMGTIYGGLHVSLPL